MENKYYIPTVEEFYIGFEHEILYKGKFEPLTVTSWPDFEDIHYALNLDSVRVKYLDREDIESLGFVCKWSERSIYYYKLNDCLIQYTDIPNARLEIFDDNILDKYRQVLFRGVIKNKSELVKLLKQLRIC